MPPSAQASTGKTDKKTAKTVIFLKTTDRPVKEIARDAGYRDALVFSKAFKKRFDMSPRNYRLSGRELEMRYDFYCGRWSLSRE